MEPSYQTTIASTPERGRSAWSQVLARLRQGDARLDVVVLGAFLTLAIFVADLFIPLGIASGVLYIAPVFLAMWLPDRRLIVVVAAVCSLLTLAGLWLSPLGPELSIALPNRLLAVAAIWTVALLSLQRKRFDAALSESEATNRAVLATTADGILTLDQRGHIASVNPAVELIFGYQESELRGRHFTALLDSEDAGLFRRNQGQYLQQLTADAAPMHEMGGMHKSGACFPIEVVLVPVTREQGLRYTVTVRDISERRILEQHLLRRSIEERRAFGHTLHEEVGQALTGLSLIGRQMARRLEGRDLAEAREVSDLATLLHDLDVQALQLFGGIAPIDASGGLPNALCEMVRSLAERHGVSHRVTQTPDLAPLDEFTAVQLYDIVRELLTGYLDSGSVGHLDLQIGRDSNCRCVCLRLRGITGDPSPEWAGLLHHVRYRAKLIGARLETTTPAEGELLITCSWPETVALVRANGDRS